MRVRIRKQAEGLIDGVSLRYLVPGFTYAVDEALGRYLETNGIAEEVSISNPALVIPLDDPYAFEQLTRGVTVLPLGGILVLEKRHGAPDRRRTSRSNRRHK
jgi:hypothetical protein